MRLKGKGRGACLGCRHRSLNEARLHQISALNRSPVDRSLPTNRCILLSTYLGQRHYAACFLFDKGARYSTLAYPFSNSSTLVWAIHSNANAFGESCVLQRLRKSFTCIRNRRRFCLQIRCPRPHSGKTNVHKTPADILLTFVTTTSSHSLQPLASLDCYSCTHKV